MTPDATETTALRTTVAFLRMAMQAGDLRASRSYLDVYTDRLARALTEPTLSLAMEHLLRALNVNGEHLYPPLAAEMLRVANGMLAPRLLSWVRGHTRLAAMLAATDAAATVEETLETIGLPEAPSVGGIAPDAGTFAVSLRARCLSPLTHGADGKAGNATLFRRMQVLTETGGILHLPYYAGNAIRGQLRDLLAAHFLRTLDVRPALWFFYAIYSGGALEEQSTALKAVTKRLGADGTLRTEGIREFRLTLPALSLLGCALGNRVLAGRCQVFDLRPMCREWGTGDVPAASLLMWEYLTRREDREDHAENHAMIASTECLKPGVSLMGGVEIDHGATALERSALGLGLRLLQDRGMLGAENRRGMGRIVLEMDGAPDPIPYETWLAAETERIRTFLRDVGAVED